MNLSVKEEIKLDLHKTLRVLLIKVLAPIGSIYIIIWAFVDVGFLIERTLFYLLNLKDGTLWLSLFFLIPIYFLFKDLFIYLYDQMLDLVNALINPSYVKVYNHSLYVRGCGLIEEGCIERAWMSGRTIYIFVSRSKFKTPNFFMRLLYCRTMSIKDDLEQEVLNIQLFVDAKKLNVAARDVKDIIPQPVRDSPHLEPHLDWDKGSQSFKSIDRLNI